MLFVFRGSLVLNLDLNKVSRADRRKCSARNVETSCCFSLHDRSCQAVGMTLMASYLLVHKNPKAFFSCTFTFPVTSSPSAAAPSTFTTRCIIYVQSSRRKMSALMRRIQWELQTSTQSLLGTVVTQQSCIVCKQASVQRRCQKEGLNNAQAGSDRQEVTIQTQKHKSSIIQEDLFPQILLPLYCSVSTSCHRLCNFKESLEWKRIPPMLSQTIKQQKEV